MDLDFSRLDSLAYRCFPTEEARDTLIEQGFMVIEGEKSPFDGLEAPGSSNSHPEPTQAVKREIEPSTGISTGRNYPAMYEEARAYHERHNPPQLTPEYWEEAMKDLLMTARQYGNDPFMTALLSAVYGEMERAYKETAGGQGASPQHFTLRGREPQTGAGGA